MASSEYPSHSSLDIVPTNSKSSDLEVVNLDKKSELEIFHEKSEDNSQGIRQVETCISRRTESQKQRLSESSFRGCRKCNGLIGVPISYFSDHCLEQFFIVGTASAPSDKDSLNLGYDYSSYIGYNQDRTPNGRNGTTFGKCPVIVMDDKKHQYYENGDIRVQTIYNRVFIRRKPVKEQ